MLKAIDKNNRPSFTCPGQIALSGNIVESYFTGYRDPAKKILENFADFLQNYRTMEFDYWKTKYEGIEQGMKPWKSTRFVENLQSGDVIYESACGVGMNLHMTVGILKQYGIENLTVYGNEYLAESAELANRALDALLPQVGARKGGICQGDSTNLSYIPDNSFDLVYSGYISRLYDPLDLNLDEDDLYSRNEELCRSQDDEWMAKQLLAIGAERQSEWHRKWVGEMIRIAKPGKAIIIEQARESECKSRPGFDVPTRDWWRQAIDKYNWDVDPESLDFEKEHVFGDRYNLLMKKKPAN